MLKNAVKPIRGQDTTHTKLVLHFSVHYEWQEKYIIMACRRSGRSQAERTYLMRLLVYTHPIRISIAAFPKLFFTLAFKWLA